MYLRNAWYMAGWDADFAPGNPVGMHILNERVLVYRTDEGAIVALEDRCAHRLAPLSKGRCEGANIRCMYHGVMFAPDGRCVEIPGQDVLPRNVRVRSYPAIERFGGIWIWMGDPDKADENLLPPFVGYHSPDWAMTPGRMDYAAPASLIHDNLLDLSHIAFVHLNSFAGGNPASGQGWIDADTVYEKTDRGVRVTRWMKNMPAISGSGGRALADGERVDVFTSYEFIVPGIFLQMTERWRQGSYEMVDGRPHGVPLFSTFTCQAVTPRKENTASYFFAYGPWAADAELKDSFAALGKRAFEEDREMIEAQYSVIQETQAPRMLPMVMDKAVLLYEGVIRKLLKEEGASESPAAAVA